MNISDEMLMAYADGELDARQRVQVEQAVKQDAQLAAKLAKHRGLRQHLHRELDGVLTEAVPDRLLDLLKTPANTRTEAITDLNAHRAAKQTLRRAWVSREWFAMVACLVAGICLGVFVLSDFRGGALVATRDGALIAEGALATALNTQLASTQNKSNAVQIGLSFRDRAGDYCRTFAAQEGQIAGLACNSGDRWRVHMLTATERRASAEYRQAGSEMPAAVLALVEQKISGEALDADAESAARNSNWKQSF